MSDLALQLIAENKRTRAPFLDLGNCGLTKVPVEVGDLVWLESLSLATKRYEWEAQAWQAKETQNTGRENERLLDIGPLRGLTRLRSVALGQVADLAPLAGLTNLQTLFIANATGCNLTPLANLIALTELHVSAITDLEPIGRLSVLHSLYIQSTEMIDLAPLAGLSCLQNLFLLVQSRRITDLAPLAGLSGLQSLYVPNTQITDLVPLARLSALQTLDISHTQISDLAPLAGLSALQLLVVRSTQIIDLAPLAGLSALRVLDASNTQITGLEPLSGLSCLGVLFVSNTQITDLAPLAGLSTLQGLLISKTPITDLAPLAGLSALKFLVVSETQITNLAPLGGLHALENLNISNTQVTDLFPLISLIGRGLPVLWSLGTDKRVGLHVQDCPLTNPPPEIVKQGNEAILNYFEERRQSKIDHLYEAKMLILGEGGAGKTSLLRRLYQPNQPLPTESESTKGISIYQHHFDLKNGRSFRLNVWDFGGQEIYHATHQFFLTRRSLYLLVDDTRKDHKSVSDEGFKYWLELIDVFGGRSPVLIFQNEKGGRSKAIDIGGIKGRYDNVKERYAGNLERTDAAGRLRDAIEFYATHLSHIGDELPAHWIKVREDIEVRAGNAPYISQDDYFQIYTRHLDFDRSKALHLSRYLHDLGVFLHFQDDPLLARTVILQNQWATEAVFRILDDETVKAKYGRFDRTDCEPLWQDSAYADMHPELLALMKNFELCYELRDSQPPIWLAPPLLPPTKPTQLKNWNKPDDLVLRYRYDFLPKGMISRLTVRLHRYVRNPDLAWVTGVLFEREKTELLVELLPTGNEIELRSRGPERKALLDIVAADLDALNESFQGLRDKVDKRIPCNCKHCRTAPVPNFFGHKTLLRRKENNRLKVECPISFDEVDVLELLDASPRQRPSRALRIFLASSSELREDRDAFDLYFRQQNDHLRKKGTYLEIIRWENFLDAMSETRLQDEYNEAIRDCDLFICLFFTKTGKFTEEEFNVAHRQFKDQGKPRIYTYFKNADIKTGSARKEDLISLWAFQERLKELGHFYTNYDNIEHLKRHFSDQLDKLLD